MKTPIQNELDILIDNMRTKLAPAILELMDNLGYKKRFKFLSKEGAEYVISRESIVWFIENTAIAFQPYISPYNSHEDEIDRTHTLMLEEFHSMQKGFIALSERINKVKEATKWIDNMAIVYERKVIVEKTEMTSDNVH